MMKEIEIDLSQSFEKVLEAVFALPNRSVNGVSENGIAEKDLRLAIRGLYEAANGRQVETGIGLIPIAPPIAPFLKTTPLRAKTLEEFLVAAAVQIVCLPWHRTGRSPAAPIANRPGKPRSNPRIAIHKRPIGARSRSHSPPPEVPAFPTPKLTAFSS